MTVLSTTLPAPGTEKNAIRKEASAKLSLRVAPGQTPEQLFDAVRDVLRAPLPGQLSVEVTQLSTASSWDYQPRGPAFEAANRAYEKAWGRPLMQVGIGGTIPFVALFGRRFGDLPLILNGVIDPETTAHGPNESMHLGVFERAIAANVYLLAELSTLPLSRTPR
jgi:acetylornithine deacetylase/succinyl-diaminopimelate desuccinylase-like protein